MAPKKTAQSSDSKTKSIFEVIATLLRSYYKRLSNEELRTDLSLISKRINLILGLYDKDKFFVRELKRQKSKNSLVSLISYLPFLLTLATIFYFIKFNPTIYMYFVRVAKNTFNLLSILSKNLNALKGKSLSEILLKVFEVDGVDFSIIVTFIGILLALLISSIIVGVTIRKVHKIIKQTIDSVEYLSGSFKISEEDTDFKDLNTKQRHYMIFRKKTILFCDGGLLIDIDTGDLESILKSTDIWTQTSTYPIKVFYNHSNRHLGFILIGAPLLDLYQYFTNIKVPPKGKKIST